MCICAVVVAYHPAAAIIKNIAALLDQVDEVVIVDNGSAGDSKASLDKLSSYRQVSVIYNQENLGIAAALNIGVRHAKAAGYEWVATFDQDSSVMPGMIMTMLQAYNLYPDKDKIAGLSPRYQNQSTGGVRSSPPDLPYKKGLPYAEKLVVMSSGNLLKSSIFDAVGYFNEALFIDHVDTEFCLRCAQQGYKIIEVRDAILLHQIGFPVQHKILWRWVTTANHSSLRRYYVARNGLYVYKKFALIFPAWVAHDAYNFLKLIVLVVLFESDKSKNLLAIFRGVIHGLSGRMGKLNESI